MMLDEVKLVLRINAYAFDVEVQDLIDAARADLVLSGVTQEKANSDDDPLIKRAIKTYCKANFGWNNPDAEKLHDSYEALKTHLSSSKDYTEAVV